MMLNLALWAGGAALIVIAVLRGRQPLARMSELERLADNARRYDSWRGGRRTHGDEGGTTGADIMRGMLRQRVLAWAAVGGLGVVLVVAGFLIR